MARAPTRVLVIDDDADARNTIRLLLEIEGFLVRVAANGREALQLQKHEPADVVLTDIFMPEKDGIETIHDLRKKYPRLQIAVISGGDPSQLQRFQVVARELGVTTFLRKPVDPSLLVAAIKALAAAHEASAKRAAGGPPHAGVR